MCARVFECLCRSNRFLSVNTNEKKIKSTSALVESIICFLNRVMRGDCEWASGRACASTRSFNFCLFVAVVSVVSAVGVRVRVCVCVKHKVMCGAVEVFAPVRTLKC